MPPLRDSRGSMIAGFAICWLLNIVELGMGWLLLVMGDRFLPAVYVSIGAIGVVQVGYVAPIWRLLQRQGKPRTAKGLLLAAGVTLTLNLVVAFRAFQR